MCVCVRARARAGTLETCVKITMEAVSSAKDVNGSKSVPKIALHGTVYSRSAPTAH